MEVIAHATFAAITQSSIVTPVTQNTNLLTATSVYTAGIWHWGQNKQFPVTGKLLEDKSRTILSLCI